MFTHVVILIGIFLVWRLVRKPIEAYYHWDDPLKQSGEISVTASTEDLRERLRYKNKSKVWQ